MRKLLAIALVSCALSAACGKPRPMTFEQQQLYMAKQQCEQAATDMNPESPWGENVFWTSYFVMCMHQMGFTDAEIQTLWRQAAQGLP